MALATEIAGGRGWPEPEITRGVDAASGLDSGGNNRVDSGVVACLRDRGRFLQLLLKAVRINQAL